jgi:hypothetical protein
MQTCSRWSKEANFFVRGSKAEPPKCYYFNDQSFALIKELNLGMDAQVAGFRQQ